MATFLALNTDELEQDQSASRQNVLPSDGRAKSMDRRRTHTVVLGSQRPWERGFSPVFIASRPFG